jgi:hypothetical protein
LESVFGASEGFASAAIARSDAVFKSKAIGFETGVFSFFANDGRRGMARWRVGPVTGATTLGALV